MALERTGQPQARRSSRPRSRSGRSRAHRRPGSRRHDRAGAPRQSRDAPARRRCRDCGNPRPPRPGPAASAGWPLAQATFHSRTVPTTRRPSAAMKLQALGRQAAVAQALARFCGSGCRRRRRRAALRALRHRPAVLGAIVIISRSFPSPPCAGAHRRSASVRVRGEGRRANPPPVDVRCGRSSAARSR